MIKIIDAIIKKNTVTIKILSWQSSFYICKVLFHFISTLLQLNPFYKTLNRKLMKHSKASQNRASALMTTWLIINHPTKNTIQEQHHHANRACVKELGKHK